jgi:UDP-glucose 4-epimerase
MGILVTGGAGYIGSVVVEDLRGRDENVVVIDNLVYGHRKAVDPDIPFYEGNIGDKELVQKILTENQITACMHFSAYAYVASRSKNPENISRTTFHRR